MKRLALAACLLSVSGLAAGQTGGVIVTNGPVELPPLAFDDFQPIFSPIIVSEPFRITDLSGQVNATGRLDAAPAFPVALNPEAMLRGQAPIVTIEEEGVRLPDEQFTLP